MGMVVMAGLWTGGFLQLSPAGSRPMKAAAIAEFSKQEVVLQVISQPNITPRYNHYRKG